MPEDYQPDVVLRKFMDQLAELDGTDPKAMQLYGMIQAELENAPIYDPVLAIEEILIEGAETELAQAGYRIINAIVKPFDYDEE